MREIISNGDSGGNVRTLLNSLLSTGVSFRPLDWGASVNTLPTGTGSGAAGANCRGDLWLTSEAGTMEDSDGDAQLYPKNSLILCCEDNAGNDGTKFRIW